MAAATALPSHSASANAASGLEAPARLDASAPTPLQIAQSFSAQLDSIRLIQLLRFERWATTLLAKSSLGVQFEHAVVLRLRWFGTYRKHESLSFKADSELFRHLQDSWPAVQRLHRIDLLHELEVSDEPWDDDSMQLRRRHRPGAPSPTAGFSRWSTKYSSALPRRHSPAWSAR